MKLLSDLAADLAFGVVALRTRAERARITAQLVQGDRLVAMGTLAAGVAHEVNNSLAYVLSGVETVADGLGQLARELPAGRVDALQQTLGEVRGGLERIRQAVRDLKTFSRGDDEGRRRVELRPALESSIKIAFNEIRHRARSSRRTAPPRSSSRTRRASDRCS
jgi:C4-dicarboxylate-specific signal transduction histidine kinase